ncbi:MAG: hypothetical protein R3C03_08375 [Pirellulaceae bacterium]
MSNELALSNEHMQTLHRECEAFDTRYGDELKTAEPIGEEFLEANQDLLKDFNQHLSKRQQQRLEQVVLQ